VFVWLWNLEHSRKRSDLSVLMLLFSTNESSSEIAEIIELDVFGFDGFCPAIKEGIFCISFALAWPCEFH
jgi:hypothetical protein